MFKFILDLFGLSKPKPKITVETGENDRENQIQEYLFYKDGEYSHTVRMHYFTREQFNKIKNIN